VVLLIGLSGVSAKDVIAARAINSFAEERWRWPLTGCANVGALPGERKYGAIARCLSRLFRASRSVPEARYATAALDSARQAARLARSNLEASVDRLAAEPYASRLPALNDMLASSHRLVML